MSEFSVSGSVLTSANGSPVSGAQVTLTSIWKQFTVVTDALGTYYLERITSATYTITATSHKLLPKLEDRDPGGLDSGSSSEETLLPSILIGLVGDAP